MRRFPFWGPLRHPSHTSIHTRSFSTIPHARKKLLGEVYKRFLELPEGSPEWWDLAKSGRVWEDYFQPADSLKQGYFRVQEENAAYLRDIDVLKNSMKIPPNVVSKRLVAGYAHQSVQIEDNKLEMGESRAIDEYLSSEFLREINLAAVAPQELQKLSFPDVSQVAPQADTNQLIELRNHLIVSHWIAEAALTQTRTSGFGEEDVRYLSALTMKDLGRGGYYPGILGPKVKLGDYRQTPLQVKSNPMRIFPYHPEVPACMGRFFQWRDMMHEQKKLHPLILACQIVAYFLHIHPFPDGNGRVSRMIMHDYLLRNGYIPVIFGALEREDYLRMIIDAQDGKPDEFVDRVVTTQFEMMLAFMMENGPQP